MRIPEIGYQVRKARLARGMTQAALAASAGVSRPTVNLLEGGLIRDLGVRKVLAILDCVGLEFAWQHGAGNRRPDPVRMACTFASVSFRTVLTEDELVRALLTGRLPAGRSAHLRTLLDDAPAALLKSLAAEAQRWALPGRLQRNLVNLARTTGAAREVNEWLTNA